MKKLSILIIALTLSLTSMAQAPQAFAFQSAISDTAGLPVANKEIGIQFKIYSDTMSAPDYIEIHSATTSALGYFNVKVGDGTPTFGVFNTIDWSAGSFYLELLVDTANVSNYTSLGYSQLLSVPYALYAENTRPSVYFFGTSVSGPIVLTPTVNRGDAYNTSTGEFIAPYAGVYEINCSNGDVADYYIDNGTATLIATGAICNTTVYLNIGDKFYASTASTFSMTIKIAEIK